MPFYISFAFLGASSAKIKRGKSFGWVKQYWDDFNGSAVRWAWYPYAEILSAVELRWAQ